MSYSVEYFLQIKGEDFFTLSSKDIGFDTSELHFLYSNDVRAEVNLFGVEVLVEVTGEVTIIWTPWNYTAFLNEYSINNKVLEWEKSLIQHLGDILIFRIDEFLVEEWETEANEFWFRNKELSSRFIIWLEKQNKLHWEKISSESQEK